LEQLYQLLSQKIAPLWHKPLVGLGIAALAALSVLVWSTREGAESITILRGASAAVTFVLVGGLWLYTTRIPKNPKGKVGIAVAILSDEEREARQIEFDFVHTLRQLLQRDPAGANFHLLVLPAHVTEQISDFSSASRFLRKTRSHFMLFGQAKRRNHLGKEVHVLSLEGIVRHAPIPKDVSDRLANDFRQVLPRRVLLPHDSDVIAFEVTSAWVDLSARFIIAIAAHLSGDVLYSERLLLDVEKSLQTAQHLKGFLQPIARSLPDRIKQLYRDWLGALSDRYFMTRDRLYVKQADAVCDKLLAREPTDYPALLFKAIAEFVLRRDVKAARDLIVRCRRVQDVTWRYSLAFLHAYNGDLESAHDEYRRAFRGVLQNITVPIQSEEFIQIVLEEEPDKEHLNFCLGLINYNVKSDYMAAKRDFDRFLGSSTVDNFPWAKRRAEELCAKCDERSSEETV